MGILLYYTVNLYTTSQKQSKESGVPHPTVLAGCTRCNVQELLVFWSCEMLLLFNWTFVDILQLLSGSHRLIVVEGDGAKKRHLRVWRDACPAIWVKRDLRRKTWTQKDKPASHFNTRRCTRINIQRANPYSPKTDGYLGLSGCMHPMLSFTGLIGSPILCYFHFCMCTYVFMFVFYDFSYTWFWLHRQFCNFFVLCWEESSPTEKLLQK